MIALKDVNAIQSPPRSKREVERQLADLAKVKAKAETYGMPDFASKIGLQSILCHEQDLREELRAAELLESNSDAEIVFDGDPVRDHTIRAAFHCGRPQ
jgi:hypothetical protein